MHNNQISGFTLIELLITVVIITILAALAFPSYREYVQKANRSEGQALLNDAAARQERYFAQNNTYADTVAKLGYSTSNSTNGRYILSISNVSGSSYTLTATTQQTDSKCGNLSLTQAGTKGETGTESVSYCWK